MIHDELQVAREAQAKGQIGRSRAAARRAAGMALQEKLGIGPREAYATSFVEALKRLANDAARPEAVRHAALRLCTRVDAEYQSPSVDPVADAELIIAYCSPNRII